MAISKYNEEHKDKSREPMQVGYVAYNGAILNCKAHIDDYNRMSEEIHRWEDSGRGVPSHLLNSRNRQFKIMVELATAKRS